MKRWVAVVRDDLQVHIALVDTTHDGGVILWTPKQKRALARFCKGHAWEHFHWIMKGCCQGGGRLAGKLAQLSEAVIADIREAQYSNKAEPK